MPKIIVQLRGRSATRGGMCEWLKQAVLKTALRETVTGVRIPLPPPYRLRSLALLGISAAGSDARKTPQVRIPLPSPVNRAIVDRVIGRSKPTHRTIAQSR